MLSEVTMNDQQSNDQWIMVAERRPPACQRFILIGNKIGIALLEVQEHDGSIHRANWNGKLFQIEHEEEVRLEPEENVRRWRPNKEYPHAEVLPKKRQYRTRNVQAKASVLEKNHLLRKIAKLLEQQNTLSGKIHSRHKS
jgi:hypothetical protein